MSSRLRQHAWKALFHVDASERIAVLRGRNLIAIAVSVSLLSVAVMPLIMALVKVYVPWLIALSVFIVLLGASAVVARRGHVNLAGGFASVAMALTIMLGGAITGGLGSSAWYLLLSLFIASFTTKPYVLWLLLALDLVLLACSQAWMRVDYDVDGVPIAPFVAVLLVSATVCLYAFTERMWAYVRELEQARQHAERASEAKGVFLAHMSHELRTPLNAIIGYAELLMEESDDAPLDAQQLHVDLGRIRLAGSHLLAMINDILDVSKIEDGKMELHLERVELVGVLDDLIAIATPLAAARGNSLTLRAQPGLPEHIVCDGTRLRQILLNLLSNAAKFTERGSITLSVRLEEELLVMAVEDTGCGIAPDKLEAVFESFVQVGDRRLARAGSGLGLALSRQLAELLGGRLEVSSELGQGSVFSLVLASQDVTATSRETMLVLTAVDAP